MKLFCFGAWKDLYKLKGIGRERSIEVQQAWNRGGVPCLWARCRRNDPIFRLLEHEDAYSTSHE